MNHISSNRPITKQGFILFLFFCVTQNAIHYVALSYTHVYFMCIKKWGKIGAHKFRGGQFARGAVPKWLLVFHIFNKNIFCVCVCVCVCVCRLYPHFQVRNTYREEHRCIFGLGKDTCLNQRSLHTCNIPRLSY